MTEKRIKVISPITTKAFEDETREETQALASAGTSVDVEKIEFGTASIESEYDEALCIPGIIKVAEKAEREGFDGVFISCMGDPGVGACRERLSIPVVGPARTSMLVATDIAHSFSIVTVLESVVPLLENLAKTVGVDGKMASVRSVNIPVLELVDKERMVAALFEESKKAITEDRAHSIILGCTGMIGVTEVLQKRLNETGYSIPILYPVLLAMKYLEFMIAAGLSQSKKTYMPIPDKERNIWSVL